MVLNLEIEILARTMTAKQRLRLRHVKAADESEGSIADYAEAHNLPFLFDNANKTARMDNYQLIGPC